MEEKNVADIVRRNEQYYNSQPTKVSRYVSFSLKDTVDRIEAYLNSKHITGDTDSLGREKPFFNIVTGTRNIWYRATDIDRNNIRFVATKNSQSLQALLATIKLREWMRKENFGQFLNDWGLALATYGSAVVKFVKQGGRLIPSVVQWNSLIVDQVKFDNDVIIEKLYLTPSQLRSNPNYDKETVDSLLDNLVTRKNLDKNNKDTKSDFIEVYEVHGELSQAQYKKAKGEEVKDEDDDIFFQQMHVVCYMQKENGGGFDDFTLYVGREDNPYLITHLIEQPGRTLSIGSVENLFDAQWMVNHSQKLIKDQLDFASKIILQGADDQFVGRNAFKDIETGQFLLHQPNMPVTRMDNRADITPLQAFGQAWQVQSHDITSTTDALRGDTPPSGTAWHTVELITQQSQSLFELMTENKGLAIEQMMRQFVIPHLKTQLDTKEEIYAILDSESLTQIDAMYVPNQAIRMHNQSFFDTTMAGGIPSPYDKQGMEAQVRESLAPLGNQRFIKPTIMKDGQEVDITWKDFFKDFEWEVMVDVTGEDADLKTNMETLSTMFKTIAAMQGRPMTPEERFVFNKILDQTGVVSPLQLAQLPSPQPVQPTQGGGLPNNG